MGPTQRSKPIVSWNVSVCEYQGFLSKSFLLVTQTHSSTFSSVSHAGADCVDELVGDVVFSFVSLG